MKLIKNSILLVIVILNLLAAIINIPNIVLEYSYTKNVGIVSNTYTSFSFENIGYDSMVTYKYNISSTEKICFYRSCIGCPTYQIANLSSFSYKINDIDTIWIYNKNSQDCYTYDKSKTKIQIMPLLFVIFDFILIFLFTITLFLELYLNKKQIIETETLNPL